MRGQNNRHTGRAGDGNNIDSFSLVAGSGDADNAGFSIQGNKLVLAQPADFEAQNEYLVRVRGTDPGGLSIEKALTISAVDVPEAPVGITLDKNTVPENTKKGATVG